jgi:hypothetical protein
VTKAADTNYNVATDQVQVVFTKIDPAAISLSSSPALIVYTTAANKNRAWVTVTGGASSSGAFTFYVDPMTEEYCSITAIQATQVQIAGNQAGLCLIIVVQAADVNYNEQRAYLGVNITKMAQTISATSSASNSVPFKVAPDVATTINVTGQAGTGITRYVVDSANNTSNCSVDQATGNVTSTTIGSCRITVSRDGDSNVADSNSVVLNLTINRQSLQPHPVISAWLQSVLPPQLQYLALEPLTPELVISPRLLQALRWSVVSPEVEIALWRPLPLPPLMT